MSTLEEVKAFQKRERAKRKAGRIPMPKTAREALTAATATLANIAQTIAQFDRKCNRNRKIDTGEALEIFYEIRKLAYNASRRAQRAGQPPQVVVAIEGGNYQGYSATERVDLRVFDVDNLKAEGKTEPQRARIFERMTRGMKVMT